MKAYMSTNNGVGQKVQNQVLDDEKEDNKGYYDISFLSSTKENYDHPKLLECEENLKITHVSYRIGKKKTRRKLHIILNKEDALSFYYNFIKFVDCSAFDDIAFYLTLGLIQTQKERGLLMSEFYHWSKSGILAYLFYLLKDKPIICHIHQKFYIYYRSTKNTSNTEGLNELSLEQCQTEIEDFTIKFLKMKMLPQCFSQNKFFETAIKDYLRLDGVTTNRSGLFEQTNRVLKFNEDLFMSYYGFFINLKEERMGISQVPLVLKKNHSISASIIEQLTLPSSLKHQNPLNLTDKDEQRELALRNTGQITPVQIDERKQAFNNCLSDKFINKLLKLTRNDFKLLLILRSCLARILFLDTISPSLQTGYCFYGPTRTGKSLFQKIISYFGNATNLSSKMTKFNNYFLKDASVINIPNLDSYLTHEQTQLLRNILCKDAIVDKQKYVKGNVGFIANGVVVITTNTYPGTIAKLNKEEFKDKLIYVYFGSSIPDNELDHSLQDFAEDFTTELFMWGLTIPVHFLEAQVRSTTFYELTGFTNENQDDILTDFILNQFYVLNEDWVKPAHFVEELEGANKNFFIKKEVYSSRAEIITAFERYSIEVYGDKTPIKYHHLISQISNTLTSARFGLKNINYRPRIKGTTTRIRVIAGVKVLNSQQKALYKRGQINLKPISLIQHKDKQTKATLFNDILYGMNTIFDGVGLDSLLAEKFKTYHTIHNSLNSIVKNQLIKSEEIK